VIKKIKKFFPEINSLKLYTLVFLSLFYGLSTIVTIYIVTTLITILSGLSSVDLLMPIKILTEILKSLFDLGDKTVLIVIGLASLFLMIFFGLTKIYLISKICSISRHNLSLKILKKSLTLNSVSISKSISSNTKSLILDETANIIQQLLRPTIEILASSVFIIILLINLFFYDAKLTTLSVILFGMIYLIVFILTKSSMTKHGNLRFLSNKKRFKKIDDALNLKLLSKVLKTFDLFINRYSEDSIKMAKHQHFFEFVSNAPKIIIEAIIFLAVLIMINIGLSEIGGKSSEISMLQTFIFFSLTGLKMLPEFQKIFISISLLKFGSTAQENVLNFLNAENSRIIKQQINDNDEENIILNFSCESCYAYDKKILNQINLKIFKSDRIALQGKSGSGKTTLIHSIMGVIPINSNDKKVFFTSNVKFGYLPQETILFTGTIYENIVMGRKIDLEKENKIKEIANILFPEYEHENINIFLNREIEDTSSALSVGQKQRVGLLRAIYDYPKILILDEFTSALDKTNEEIIIKFIDKFEFCKTLIIIGHRKDSIKICNKFFKIENGDLIKIK
tara:strand:- start:4846 stop:6543 length:1698 start_codon:yes stop_codon:yes gene_type:complete